MARRLFNNKKTAQDEKNSKATLLNPENKLNNLKKLKNPNLTKEERLIALDNLKKINKAESLYLRSPIVQAIALKNNRLDKDIRKLMSELPTNINIPFLDKKIKSFNKKKIKTSDSIMQEKIEDVLKIMKRQRKSLINK